MTRTNPIISAKRATQLVFLICGLGTSSWAAMVPFAKDRLALDEAELGTLLLFLGLGAIIMMPLTGVLITKLGTRKVIALSVVVTSATLPLLSCLTSYAGMAATLFVFGCSIGSVDVAMNAHGIHVQNSYGRPIMSSLHGLFSVGGLLGSLGLGLLIKSGLHPLHAAIAISLLLMVLIISQYKKLIGYDFEKEINNRYHVEKKDSETSSKWQWLHKRILLLGFMCFSFFLIEGAMLDWSAVFMRDFKNVSLEFAGVGYAAFSIAMAAMRMIGDAIISKYNSNFIVTGGCFVSGLGLLFVILGSLPFALLGCVLVGVGAANVVPIFFSEGGRISGVSPTVSVSAITTMGYAGQLAGPALLGYVANLFTLKAAFGVMIFLSIAVAIVFHVRKGAGRLGA